jgi:hypothetical protein
LRTLAWKKEKDGRIPGLTCASQDSLRVKCREDLDGIRHILTDHNASIVERDASHLEGVGHVRKVDLKVLPQVLGQILGDLLQGRGRGGRQDQKLARP